MSVWDFFGALRRRWYVAIPMVVIAGLAGLTFLDGLTGEYRYDATIRLDYDQGEVAEYLEVPVSMRSLTQATQIAVSDLTTEVQLDSQGHTAWFRVRILDFARIPVLEITTEDPNEAVALSLSLIHI